ncbi:MAG: NAD(P)/FAD-dependent oxidoreductase, partial [Candidatus Heimdallarchaeaceae archaeon]
MYRVVVLGGGFAGLTVANKMARKAKKNNIEVTLIEPLDFNTYEPGLLLYAFNKKPLSKLTKPIHKILHKRVKYIRMRAKRIDTEANKVILEHDEEIPYDYLILATGVHYIEKDFKFNEQKNIHHFYSIPETEKLRRMLRSFEGGTIVISPSTVPYKCPPAPVEFTLLLDEFLRKRGLREKTTIKYLYPLSKPFTIPEVAEKVEVMYEKRGIEFISFCNYERIDVENKKFISFEGEEIDYDELVLVPLHEGQQVIKDSGLGDREGYVPTDKFTLKVKGYDNIYAIGDCTDLPTSKSGTVAHFSAGIVVKNIIYQIKGKEPKAKYDGRTLCFLVTDFKRAYLLNFSYEQSIRKYGLHSW